MKAKRSGADAYHQRQRKARDRDDQSLLEAMRSAPDALIGEWAEAIGKSRSSVLSALKRLRDAGLAESVGGKWKLAEELPPREPTQRSAARRHEGHGENGGLDAHRLVATPAD